MNTPKGGMGVVYEAEQDQPRRIVALKIIKPGMISDELLRRFEQESPTLVATKKYGEAEPYLLNSYPKILALKPAPGPESAFTVEAEAGECILALYREWGEPEKVAEWRQKLQSNKPATTTPVFP